MDTKLALRNIKFDFRQNRKKYWYDNNPVKTLYANTITASIPYGEKFIFLSVRLLLKDLKDKSFRKKVWQFSQQEANHSREHLRLYRQLVKPFYPRLKLNKRGLYKVSQGIAWLVGRKIHFSTIAAIEHFTATTSEMYLLHPELFNGMEEQFHLLWLWHFVEEVEHRAISFDILTHIRSGYVHRIIGFFLGSIFIAASLIGPFVHMAIHDKLYRSWGFYKEVYYFFWRREGIIKKAIVPYLQFLLPHYHPNRYIKLDMLNHYQEKINARIALMFLENKRQAQPLATSK